MHSKNISKRFLILSSLLVLGITGSAEASHLRFSRAMPGPVQLMEHSSLPGQKVENEAVPIRKKLESMFRGGLKLFGPRDSKATGFDFGYGFLGGLGPSVRLGLITPFLVAIYRIHKLSAATPDNNLKEVGLVGGISLPLGGR